MGYMKCSSYSFLLSLILMADVFGQEPPSSEMKTTTQSDSKIPHIDRLDRLKNESSKSVVKQPLPKPVAAPKLIKQEAEYLHPGILVNVKGRWEGSDHLLNISGNIGVFVTIVKPENEELNVTEEEIRKDVELIFNQNNIKPQILVLSGSAPLPVFQVELFVYPIERGYVAYCSGRLFESVVLDRFKMDPSMAFQAITWEKQHLIVSPKDQFIDQLTKTVQDIAETFGERYQAYEKIKKTL